MRYSITASKHKSSVCDSIGTIPYLETSMHTECIASATTATANRNDNPNPDLFLAPGSRLLLRLAE